jgi:hypothetical protein
VAVVAGLAVLRRKRRVAGGAPVPTNACGVEGQKKTMRRGRRKTRKILRSKFE